MQLEVALCSMRPKGHLRSDLVWMTGVLEAGAAVAAGGGWTQSLAMAISSQMQAIANRYDVAGYQSFENFGDVLHCEKVFEVFLVVKGVVPSLVKGFDVGDLKLNPMQLARPCRSMSSWSLFHAAVFSVN